MDLRATRTDDRTEPATGGTATLLAPDRPHVGEARAGEPGGQRDQRDEEGWASQDDAGAAQSSTPAPAPRSNLAIWLVLAGVVASVLLGVLVGSRAGVLGVSATLAACGVARAVVSGPGPVGIVIRGRVLDVVMFASLATAIFVLGVSAPGV
ncbi:DUF3017 domain-containing protein [Antribacter sp. KLBMP9083]|uniref:DUF3017 domain-containing protein n=1 Tax=Antribacter soli TaxID=2910976 RepID=A0AA41QHA4_9MICO|nr:DUF3017 domain-containing protein [Antribacter soli]MCF4122646.1 DUF3017 domain-containing protein [Antribacter soli]